MNQDVIATMEAEEAELSRKLDAVRQFLAVYRGGEMTARVRAAKPSTKTATNAARSADERMDKFGPYGQRIVEIADRILPGCDGNPVPTRDLVEHIEQSGVSITGNNKVNSLSALLARSSKMKGWGRAGWTRAVAEDGALLRDHLAQQGQNENGEVATSPDAEGGATPSFEVPAW